MQGHQEWGGDGVSNHRNRVGMRIVSAGMGWGWERTSKSCGDGVWTETVTWIWGEDGDKCCPCAAL